MSENRSLAPPRLGIVVALSAEAACLSQLARPGQPSPLPCGELLICGIGPQRAARAADTLIQRGARALLIWGTAAALSDSCRPGDILIPETLLSADAISRPLHQAWRHWWQQRCAGLMLSSGPLYSSAIPLSNPADKAALHASSGAVAVDMESAAVAERAERAGLPCLSIRAIADDHRQGLPAAALKAIDAYGRPSLPRLMAALCRQPGQLPQLLRLGRQFRQAQRSLRHIHAQNGYNLAPADLIPH